MKNIVDYIIYLRTQCNLKVTIHPKKEFSYHLSKNLMPFNIHDNSYCLYLKCCPKAYRHCVEKQQDVLKKCSEGSYCGVCYAGVREFIYPISYKAQTIGFICVSGYQCANSEQYLVAISQKYNLELDELKIRYVQLKERLPLKKTIDTLINPLCDMLELALIKSDGKCAKNISFPERVEQYIRFHHTENISSKDICQEFNCCRTFLSKNFNQHYGKSIRQYITELRIADAKNLLLHSDLSVTEIAFSVGFSDSNYFSSIFKKYVNQSPLAYKKHS